MLDKDTSKIKVIPLIESSKINLNSVFNVSNMPTAFLETFKKMESFKTIPQHNELGHSDYYRSDYDEYSSQSFYKPISALMPPKGIAALDPYNKVRVTRFLG